MKTIKSVILPDTGAELLRREAAAGFAAAGVPVLRVAPDLLFAAATPGATAPIGSELDALLEEHGPALFFSVNFQGLERVSEVLDAVAKTGGDVAVWCVDNPWNLLSAVRDPRWREALICVTDGSFVEPLRRNGARRVLHLPPAASPDIFSPDPLREQLYPAPADPAPLVFVGRSAFPGKERFFSGITLPDEAFRRARAMLRQGERPDLLWWESAFGLDTGNLWPGKAARAAAFGAEQSNLAWRRLCLEAATDAARDIFDAGMDVYGDAGWQGHLPRGARLFGPVDYYTRLPSIYAKSRYSLALTSLQLPHGLNQRHFDVWIAGGVCLSDNSPGLALFPEELTRPIRFRNPQELTARIRDLEKGHTAAQLGEAWRAYLTAEHTYACRMRTVLDAVHGAGAAAHNA